MMATITLFIRLSIPCEQLDIVIEDGTKCECTTEDVTCEEIANVKR